MADQDNKFDKLSATAAQSAMVGMVISGRAARACDVCGKERARWYCAADMAYLCERCDGAVHSANAVAGRHERVRLGPNGTPMKMKSTPAVYVKREATAVQAAHPSAHINPRKRPRSIRRHKPSSLHASKRVIGLSIQASSHGHVSAHASSYSSAGSILASTHGVMIDNPRSNPDFIANMNSNELFMNSFSVKAEPYSPVDFGDQVKVPDHLDDDHLLESLFDFRVLQDDDLFLHQVPIYNPLRNQDLSRTLDSAHVEEQEHEEKKPFINTMTSQSCCADDSLSPELSQAAEDSKGLSFKQRVEDSDAPSFANCGDAVQSIDPNSDICDLDQLDFDCVLQGNDEDSEGMNHSSMDMDIISHDYMDVYSCDATAESGFTEPVSHDNCNMDDADGRCESEQHPGYVAQFGYNAMRIESPRTWLCKVKVESPTELGSLPGQHGNLYDDALLRKELTCKGFSSDTPATFKLGLKLNFEDVVRSWSDRGTFWTDGHGPSHVGNCLDFLGGCFVPEMSVSRPEGEVPQIVPVLSYRNKQSEGSAREASVLRYREKRRTRLFSKRIRYEVRKLNAEKRPRMKGRFIKRMAIQG